MSFQFNSITIGLFLRICYEKEFWMILSKKRHEGNVVTNTFLISVLSLYAF